jgi:hypothetical protein
LKLMIWSVTAFAQVVILPTSGCPRIVAARILGVERLSDLSVGDCKYDSS